MPRDCDRDQEIPAPRVLASLWLSLRVCDSVSELLRLWELVCEENPPRVLDRTVVTLWPRV
jgi:hypothetical protein